MHNALWLIEKKMIISMDHRLLNIISVTIVVPISGYRTINETTAQTNQSTWYSLMVQLKSIKKLARIDIYNSTLIIVWMKLIIPSSHIKMVYRVISVFTTKFTILDIS